MLINIFTVKCGLFFLSLSQMNLNGTSADFLLNPIDSLRLQTGFAVFRNPTFAHLVHSLKFGKVAFGYIIPLHTVTVEKTDNFYIAMLLDRCLYTRNRNDLQHPQLRKFLLIKEQKIV